MSEQMTEVGEAFRLLPLRFRRGQTDRRIVYYFSVDDEKWTVIINPESCEVLEGKAVEDADCFLKTTTEIFLATVRGQYVPTMMDLMRGKVKTNSPALLLTFKAAFDE